jgi:hypothetical protein
MAATGEVLKADLERLLALGQIDLPQLAYIYARLNHEVAGTVSGDTDAFSRSHTTRDGSAALGAMYQSFSGLRNMLQDALAATAVSVEEAGQAIVSIANTYAVTDGLSVAALTNAVRGVDNLPTTPGRVTFSDGSQQG